MREVQWRLDSGRGALARAPAVMISRSGRIDENCRERIAAKEMGANVCEKVVAGVRLSALQFGIRPHTMREFASAPRVQPA